MLSIHTYRQLMMLPYACVAYFENVPIVYDMIFWKNVFVHTQNQDFVSLLQTCVFVFVICDIKQRYMYIAHNNQQH